jgi:PAS domain S-box-containing protein
MVNLESELDRAEHADPFARAFMQSGLGIALVSLESAWIAVNPALSAMLGYEQRELVGRSVLEVTHPDDVDSSRRTLPSLLAGDCKSISLDQRYLHRDGRVVWARLHLTLARDDAGRPLHFLAQTEDITSQRNQAAFLCRAEARFRAAFDVATAGIALVSLDWHYLEVNRAYCAMFGYAQAELLGASVAIIVPPEMRARGATAMQRAADMPTSTYEELRCLHRDGHAVYIRLSTSAVADGDGRPLFYVGHAQDITELRRVEQERRAGEARLQAVLANAPIAINAVDEHGVFTFSGGSTPHCSA